MGHAITRIHKKYRNQTKKKRPAEPNRNRSLAAGNTSEVIFIASDGKASGAVWGYPLESSPLTQAARLG